MVFSDTYFQQNPKNVLGTPTTKKRGDRGVDAIEHIVEGSLVKAMISIVTVAGIKIPEVGSIKKANGGNAEKDRLRLLSVAMEIELELIELELQL